MTPEPTTIASDCAPHALASSSEDRPRRELLIVLLIALSVLVIRGWSISNAQSERFDDEYHLNRGVAFLRQALHNRPLNDPPLGEALGAIPLWLTGSYDADDKIDRGLYGHRLSPQTLLNLVAVWKSVLFLPMVGVVFAWVRELYGRGAAWVAAAALLIEPTLAAHVPLPAVDVLGVEGIVIACYAAWRYARRPSLTRLAIASLAVAVAMLLKNTAIILPGVVLVMAIVWWSLPQSRRSPHAAAMPSLRIRFTHLAVAWLLVPLMIWALTLFDVSVPLRRNEVGRYDSPTVVRILRSEWPAGSYVRSVATGIHHGSGGHPMFLNGVKGRHGRWDYFPTVATYKLPIGLAAILALGACSFVWQRPRVQELSLAVPGLAWTVFLLNTEINIGFRHFLPALAFMLMAASRLVTPGPRLALRTGVATTLLAVALVETARWHPNYLSYVNGVRDRAHLAISDSNLDWGQSLKALRTWADRRPADRPLSFAYFGSENPLTLDRFLGGSRVRVVMRPRAGGQPAEPLPQSGLFVVSPTALAGPYDPLQRLRPLWDVEPVERIDRNLLVYDLDRLAASGPIPWPTTAPTTRPER